MLYLLRAGSLCAGGLPGRVGAGGRGLFLRGHRLCRGGQVCRGHCAQRSGRKQEMRGRWVRAGGRGGSGGALTVAHISPG